MRRLLVRRHREAEALLIAGRILEARRAWREAEARAGPDCPPAPPRGAQMRREGRGAPPRARLRRCPAGAAGAALSGHMPKPGQADPALEAGIAAALDARIAGRPSARPSGGLAAGLRHSWPWRRCSRAQVTRPAVLPCDVRTYEADFSVAPAGDAGWRAFRACCRRSASSSSTTAALSGRRPAPRHGGARRAMGLARLHARHRDGEAVATRRLGRPAGAQRRRHRRRCAELDRGRRPLPAESPGPGRATAPMAARRRKRSAGRCRCSCSATCRASARWTTGASPSSTKGRCAPWARRSTATRRPSAIPGAMRGAGGPRPGDGRRPPAPSTCAPRWKPRTRRSIRASRGFRAAGAGL